MDLSIWGYIILALAGLLCGIINTLAGSGSLVTLPVFMYVCGLPAPIANGTNRLGLLAQTLTGVVGLRKNGIHNPVEVTWWLAVPSVVGALLGSRLAVDLDEKVMRYTIAGLMVFMFFFLLIDQKRWLKEQNSFNIQQIQSFWSIVAYFLIGLYGGFIQAGVGIFLTAALVLLSKFTLKSSLPMKILLAFLITVPALAVFIFYGQIHWGYGILMAIFQGLGAWMAVRFVIKIPNANLWIYRLLLVIVATSAIKMLFD